MVADPHRLFMSAEEYLVLDRNSLEARYEFIAYKFNRRMESYNGGCSLLLVSPSTP